MQRRPLLVVALTLGLFAGLGLLWRQLDSPQRTQRIETEQNPSQTDMDLRQGASTQAAILPSGASETARTDAAKSLVANSGGKGRAANSSGRTLSGRLTFPADTPPDEEVWISAHRKPGDDEALDRVQAQGTGEYELTFPGSLKVAYLQLEAKYLYLENNSKVVRLADAKRLPNLSPEVGARFRLQLTAPSGSLEEWAQFECGLSGQIEGQSRGSYRRIRNSQFEGFETLINAIPPRRSYWLSVESDRFVEVNRSSLHALPGQTTDLSFALNRAAIVAGQVLDSDGKPVPFAEVNFRQKHNHWNQEQTDTEGKFRITGLDIKETQDDPPSLHVSRQGYEDKQHPLPFVPAGTELLDVQVVLESGSSIEGHVLWPDGEPVAAGWVDLIVDGKEPQGAANRVFMIGGEEPLDEPQRVPLGADGSFAFSGLSPREFELHAWAAGRPDPNKQPNVEGLSARERRKALREYNAQPHWHSEATAASGMKSVELIMQPGFSFDGKLTDDTGKALERFALIASRDASEIEVTEAQSFRDKQGLFQVTGLRAGKYEVVATSSGHQISDMTEIVLANDQPPVHLDLALDRLATVRGSIVGSTEQIALAQVTIELQDDDQQERSDTHVDRASDTTDKQGAFAFKKKVPPGRIKIEAKTKDHATGVLRDLLIEPGSTLEGLEISVRPTATLEVLVSAPDGSAAQDWYVEVRSGATGQWVSNTQTNPAGKLFVHSLDAGSYNLTFHMPNEVVEEIKQQEGPNHNVYGQLNLNETVTLSEGEQRFLHQETGRAASLRVFGQVTLNGAPMPRTFVVMSPYGRMEMGNNKTVNTDSDGKFELMLQRGGSFVATCPGSAAAKRIVEIPVGAKEFELNFEIKAKAKINLSVLDSEEQPVNAYQVRLEAIDEVYATTSNLKQSTHSFENLTTGRYRLVVTSSSGLGGAGPIDIGHGEERSVTIKLQPFAQLSGRIIRPNGTPAEHCQVLVSTDLPALGFTKKVRTDEDGKFTFEQLPSGPIFLRALTYQSAQAQAQRINLAPGSQATTEVTLTNDVFLDVSTFDQEGQLCKAIVRVIDAEGFNHVLHESLSSQSLGSTVHGLTPGEYTVEASIPGQFGSKVLQVGPQDRTTVEVHMQ